MGKLNASLGEYAGMKKTLFDLPVQRQERILEELQREGRVIARNLALALEISEDTIRRDLKELADLGHCKRVHGGAVRVSASIGTFEKRRGEDSTAKTLVGRTAAKLFESKQTLFIDVSTTNLEVARALDPGLNLTVITNSPVIACELYQRPGYEVILLGGRVDSHSGGTSGAKTLQEIRSIRADVVLLGACGLHADYGVTTFGYEDAEVKKAMVEHSERVIIAAQLSKLNTAATYFVTPLNRVDQLVLEAKPDADLTKSFESSGIEIHIANSRSEA